MAEEIRTYFKIVGPDGYYLTDYIGNDLEFETEEEAEEYVLDVFDGDFDSYTIEEYSNTDKVTSERWSQEPEEESLKEAKLDDGEYIDSLAVEGKWTCVYTSGDNREIPFEEEDYLVSTFDTEEEATAFAEEKIKETSDVYGHNFVSVFDPEGDEILTLNSYDDNFRAPLTERISCDEMKKFEEHPFFKDFNVQIINKFIEIYLDFIGRKEDTATPEEVYDFMSEEGLGLFALDNMNNLL